MDDASPPSVFILGAGVIGCAFSAAFADAGAEVTLADPDPDARSGAPGRVRAQADAIAGAGLLLGRPGRWRVAPDADLSGADLVLECGPESLDAKRAIFAHVLAHAAPDTVIASASSAIPISRTVPDTADQARCLVAHPANPPSVLRVIELAPGPGTRPGTVARAVRLFGDAGFAPVVLGREIEGFVMNRLQGALLREAYRLVGEGVASAGDIDTVVRLSLGPRWALSGPFETAELNTPGGIRAHAARMGPAYRRMGEERGERVDWSEDLVARVERDRRAALPADDIPLRAAWRARAVARLVAARDRIARDAADD